MKEQQSPWAGVISSLKFAIDPQHMSLEDRKEHILSMPRPPEGYEHLLNTIDHKWRDSVMEDDVVASIPRPSDAMTSEEIAAQGMFGLYARRKPKGIHPGLA